MRPRKYKCFRGQLCTVKGSNNNVESYGIGANFEWAFVERETKKQHKGRLRNNAVINKGQKKAPLYKPD